MLPYEVFYSSKQCWTRWQSSWLYSYLLVSEKCLHIWYQFFVFSSLILRINRCLLLLLDSISNYQKKCAAITWTNSVWFLSRGEVIPDELVSQSISHNFLQICKVYFSAVKAYLILQSYYLKLGKSKYFFALWSVKMR